MSSKFWNAAPASVLVFLAVAGGCGDGGIGPIPGAGVRAVYFGNAGTGVIREDGAFVDGLNDLEAFEIRGTATSPDLPWIVLSVTPEETASLSFYNVCVGREVDQVNLRDEPFPNSSVRPGPGFTLGMSSDGDRIYYWRAHRDDKPGIAVLDGSVRNLVGFVEGLEPLAGEFGLVPPGPVFPSGGIAVVGERFGAAFDEGPRVYLASSAGELVDSVGGPGTSMSVVTNVLAEADGRHLLLGGPSALARVDLTTGSVVAAAQAPGTGTRRDLAEVGDGTFLVTDTGLPIELPGSGYVYRLNESLATVARIDVTTIFDGTLESPTATQTWDVAVDAELGVAWVVSGTRRRGPLFPLQPPRLLEIDLDANEVTRVMDAPGLGDVRLVGAC